MTLSDEITSVSDPDNSKLPPVAAEYHLIYSSAPAVACTEMDPAPQRLLLIPVGGVRPLIILATTAVLLEEVQPVTLSFDWA